MELLGKERDKEGKGLAEIKYFSFCCCLDDASVVLVFFFVFFLQSEDREALRKGREMPAKARKQQHVRKENNKSSREYLVLYESLQFFFFLS